MHEYENINDHIILYIYFSFSDWVVIINILINNIILFMRILMIIYENINDYNPIRKRKKLIVFDEMIADIMTSKRFQAIIKELLDAQN